MILFTSREGPPVLNGHQLGGAAIGEHREWITNLTSTHGEAREALHQQADARELMEVIAGAGVVGTRGMWALKAAAEAARADGIAGVITLHIPAKTRDYLDITFTLGTVEVVSRWAG